MNALRWIPFLVVLAHADEKVYRAAVVLMADDKPLEWTQQSALFVHDSAHNQFRSERLTVHGKADTLISGCRIVFPVGHLDQCKMEPPQRMTPGHDVVFDVTVKYSPMERDPIVSLFAATQQPGLSLAQRTTADRAAIPPPAPEPVGFTTAGTVRPTPAKRGAVEIIVDVIDSAVAGKPPTDPETRRYVEMVFERFDAFRTQKMDFPTAWRRAQEVVTAKVIEDAMKGAIQ